MLLHVTYAFLQEIFPRLERLELQECNLAELGNMQTIFSVMKRDIIRYYRKKDVQNTEMRN